MQSRYSRGAIARLFLDIIAAGAGVTAQAPTCTIQRVADGKWFQASDGTWVSTPVNNAMTELDSVNLPGRYHLDFNQSLDTLAGSTQYIVKKSNITVPALEYEDLVFGPLAGSATFELCSIQGTVYDAQGAPRPNSLVRATLIPVYKDGLGRSIESGRVIATYTNELGDFDLSLVRGGTFHLEVVDIGYNRKIVVPDQSSVLFTDL